MVRFQPTRPSLPLAPKRTRLRPPMHALALCLVALHAHAAALATEPEDLGNLSLEELANIQVTSVSKRSEPLSDAAARP